MSKGSWRRASQVDDKTYEDNFNAIFGGGVAVTKILCPDCETYQEPKGENGKGETILACGHKTFMK